MANSSNSSDLHLLLTVLLSASHVAVRIYAVVARHVNLPLPSPRYSWAHAFPHFRSLIDGTPRGGEMQHAGRMYRSFRTGAIINCYRTGTVSTGIYDVSLLERALIISRESDEPYWLMLPHAPVQTQPHPFVEVLAVLPHNCLTHVLRIEEDVLLVIYEEDGVRTALVWIRIEGAAERDVWRRMLMHLGGLMAWS